VIIGAGLIEDLWETLKTHLGSRSAYWIWDERVWNIWGHRLQEWGWPDFQEGRLILFPVSESSKRLDTVEKLAQQLVQGDADRQSVLVAVGGGVTGDVVGFLASIYMRGIPHFQVPTTLLAQVDSSVGGKTGVNLSQGKNLLGTFHQPQTVWMDPQFLQTLPSEQFRQGMAEVIKTAMIGDEDLWDYLESHAEAIKQRSNSALTRVIAACCSLKASVVESDEKEAGYRRVLNLGHTVGHALERLSDYTIPHGDAVAMGMVVATGLAVRLGKIAQKDLLRLEKLCTSWDLPTRIPQEFTPEALLSALRTDKKRLQETLHFILPVKIGKVIDYENPDMECLKKVLDEVSERQ
jgi:3-dehydroquinate synthase